MSGKALDGKRARESVPRFWWRGPRSARLPRVTQVVSQASSGAAEVAPRLATLAESRARRRAPR
jgi:hypothetical protein